MKTRQDIVNSISNGSAHFQITVDWHETSVGQLNLAVNEQVEDGN